MKLRIVLHGFLPKEFRNAFKEKVDTQLLNNKTTTIIPKELLVDVEYEVGVQKYMADFKSGYLNCTELGSSDITGQIKSVTVFASNQKLDGRFNLLFYIYSENSNLEDKWSLRIVREATEVISLEDKVVFVVS
jgi:hypothetical protein